MPVAKLPNGIATRADHTQMLSSARRMSMKQSLEGPCLVRFRSLSERPKSEEDEWRQPPPSRLGARTVMLRAASRFEDSSMGPGMPT